MTQAKKGWSYSAGEWGRNRVRAFEHPRTGRLFLEFGDNGQRKRIALGHRDRDAAKAKAEEVALAFRRGEPRPTPVPTLRTLFDNYLREVTPQKGPSTQRHDHRAVLLFLAFLGGERKAKTLSRRDWDAFIAWRRRGGDQRDGRTRGRVVGNRVITYDLKFLRSVLKWATTAGDGQGQTLLERNPLEGLSYPKEENPRRPILNDKEYAALLGVSRTVDPAFELALVLANETGHRIGAISLLRWSDVDFESQTIRWRASHDKIGFEHQTPLTGSAFGALQRSRKAQGSIGDAWIFPAPRDHSQPCSRHLFRDWWQEGEALAKIPHEAGLGWHSLRRKFATELKHVPLKDLCYLGGWKEPQTVLKCYQRADPVTMREALASRKRLETASV